MDTTARAPSDLEVDALTRRFGDVTAVDAVTFTVTAGSMVGFVGSNGAGKTTTMRMMMGVLAPDAGKVRWAGHEATYVDRSRFGYMPEERGLYPKQKVLDQLVYLGRLYGMSAQDARTTATDHLERFGLGDRTGVRLETLSLGNQQRVQIVAAVMHRPIAMVLDEPFSGLDPDAVDAMVAVLREHTSAGVPVLFSSHQLDLVERLCDRVVVLARGKVVAQGSPGSLRDRGIRRYRIVLGGDAGWLRGRTDVHVADVDRNVAVVEPLTDSAPQELLAEAVRRGPVHEFARIIPTLSEIYREVTA